MEKVLLKSINFNVRSCKDKDNYTLIYLVLYVGANGSKKQYKLPLTKVIAKYWNSKQQLPILTANGMSEEVKEQQLTINQLITDIKCALCVGNSYTINEIRQMIENKSINIFSQKEHGSLKNSEYIPTIRKNPKRVSNSNKINKKDKEMVVTSQFIKAKRTPKATRAIMRIFKDWKESSPKSEGTLSQYYYDLKAWEKWVLSTNQKDGYSLLTIDGVIAYRDFLIKNGVKPNTINYKLRILCGAINDLAKLMKEKRVSILLMQSKF